jgi:hypothetical protein
MESRSRRPLGRPASCLWPILGLEAPSHQRYIPFGLVPWTCTLRRMEGLLLSRGVRCHPKMCHSSRHLNRPIAPQHPSPCHRLFWLATTSDLIPSPGTPSSSRIALGPSPRRRHLVHAMVSKRTETRYSYRSLPARHPPHRQYLYLLPVDSARFRHQGEIVWP